MVSEFRIPVLHASPFALLRSDLRWLRAPGEAVAAREAVAVCSIRVTAPRGVDTPTPFDEEQNDLQVVFAPQQAGLLGEPSDLSRGGFHDLIGAQAWDEGEPIGFFSVSSEVVPLVLAGRRGFLNGEGRGSLLAGWHARTRGFWEGGGSGVFGTVLSLGTCEQTGVFRGDDMAFLTWFARAPGPVQIISVADELTVHSSAVLLQHLRRTPSEAKEIAQAVHSWIGEWIGSQDGNSFSAFQAGSRAGTLRGRWAPGQDLLFAQHLMTEALGASPMLERTEMLTRRGVVEQAPPDAVVLSLGSEFAPHFRHRRTGWLIAIHGFRFGPFIGEAVRQWLRRDFEPVHRSVPDSERDLAALAREVADRTGAALLVQNLIATSAGDRVPNYAWLGEAFAANNQVIAGEANLMLSGLTRHPSVSMIDSDALAAELGIRHCPDRIHASTRLLDAQRGEIHRILRLRQVPGF